MFSSLFPAPVTHRVQAALVQIFQSFLVISKYHEWAQVCLLLFWNSAEETFDYVICFCQNCQSAQISQSHLRIAVKIRIYHMWPSPLILRWCPPFIPQLLHSWSGNNFVNTMTLFQPPCRLQSSAKRCRRPKEEKAKLGSHFCAGVNIGT